MDKKKEEILFDMGDFQIGVGKMRYSNSNGQITKITKSGQHRVYKVCDICGTAQQNNYGYTISYAYSEAGVMTRRGYCSKCARKIIPILEKAIENMEAQHELMAQDYEIVFDPGCICGRAVKKNKHKIG